MKHTIELQPFSVPNFVRQVAKSGLRQDGFFEAPTIPLSDLDSGALEEMCAEFRNAVFAKAGKVPSDAGGAVVIRPCAFLCGWGWRISTPEFYCDIEPDASGNLSVFFTDKDSGREAFGGIAK